MIEHLNNYTVPGAWQLERRGPCKQPRALPAYVHLTGDDYEEVVVPCAVVDHFCVYIPRGPGFESTHSDSLQWWCAEVKVGSEVRVVADERVEICGGYLSEIRDENGTGWQWPWAIQALLTWLKPVPRAKVRAARHGAGDRAQNAVSQSGNASTAPPESGGEESK